MSSIRNITASTAVPEQHQTVQMNRIIFEYGIYFHIQILRNDLIELTTDPADKFFVIDFGFLHR